jgi:hypothetical protein
MSAFEFDDDDEISATRVKKNTKAKNSAPVAARRVVCLLSVLAVLTCQANRSFDFDEKDEEISAKKKKVASGQPQKGFGLGGLLRVTCRIRDASNKPKTAPQPKRAPKKETVIDRSVNLERSSTPVAATQRSTISPSPSQQQRISVSSRWHFILIFFPFL